MPLLASATPPPSTSDHFIRPPAQLPSALLDSIQFSSVSRILSYTVHGHLSFTPIKYQLITKAMACSVDAPSLKDLPKVATDLKSQLEGFNQSCLRDVDTNEKIVLPSAEDLATAKTQKSLFDGIEKFDPSNLKHTETQEKNPLPDKDDVAAAKQHQSLLDGVEHFDKTQMKHTTTEEKNPLPPIEAIEAEKEKNKFLNGIENFDPTKLKHTETCEKNPLPTKDIIEQEKTA